MISTPDNRSFVDLERKVCYNKGKGCGPDDSVIHVADASVVDEYLMRGRNA